MFTGVVSACCSAVFSGIMRKMLFGRKSIAHTYLDFYKEFKSKGLRHGGVYCFGAPQYMPIDLNIVKNILQDDFAHFTSHGFYQHEEDTITRNLFRMEGENWKLMRSKLTRAFSAVKIKDMCQIMDKKRQELSLVLDQQVMEKNGLIKIEDLATGYTIDVTVACIFGLESNSLRNPENCEFRKANSAFLAPNLTQPWLEYFLSDKTLYNLSYRTFPQIANFLSIIVGQLMDYRTTNNIIRKDLIHLLMDLKASSNKNNNQDEKKTMVLNNKDIIAQAFVFFTAGYETSAATITSAMYELAQNPEVQQKLREEIFDVLENNEGMLNYNAVMEMKYLDMVVQETLRKHPPVSTLPRRCTQDYLVPGTDLIIEKGTTAQISILGIHMDPEYYPNPDVFDPLRFTAENKAQRPPCSWIPFGSGPRMCLGSVFGSLQTKLGILGLIKDYQYSLVSPKTPIKLKPGVFTSHSTEEIVLQVVKVKK